MALNASREAVLDRIVHIAERVGASEGVEIVDVEWKGGGGHRMLRIYIDKPEGVSHGDCEFISRQVGTILDVEDVIPGSRYTLEVSSPGLERKLSKAGDFERFVGRQAKVLLQEPVADRRHWEGTLAGFADGLITLAPASGNPVSFPLETVERANLKFDW
ncbi:MAG: ribosome maturation factor RimP [bacterium]|nr:ribosome maturation factor RimP [bacterium]